MAEKHGLATPLWVSTEAEFPKAKPNQNSTPTMHVPDISGLFLLPNVVYTLPAQGKDGVGHAIFKATAIRSNMLCV